MVETGLLVGAGWTLLNGLVFGLVGWSVLRRPLSGEERRANQAFGLFWSALSFASIAGALFNVPAAFGVRDLALYTVLFYVLLLALCLALWGLAYYLVYLFTGTSRWFVPLALFYAGFFFSLLYVVVWAQPEALVVGRWQTQIEYERDLAGHPLVRVLTVLLIAPPVLGSLAYMTLIFKARSREQRYRIALVSLSLLVWFGSSAAASALGINRADWWHPVARMVGLLAALTVLIAFNPPRAWRAWLQGSRPPLVHGGALR